MYILAYTPTQAVRGRGKAGQGSRSLGQAFEGEGGVHGPHTMSINCVFSSCLPKYPNSLDKRTVVDTTKCPFPLYILRTASK